MKKYIFALILILLSLSARAEKGEMQLHLGAGVFIPQSLGPATGTNFIVAAPETGLKLFYGVSDNFDLGLKVMWSYLPNANLMGYTDPASLVKGDLYYNYQRWEVGAEVRWNWLPGYMVAPHLIVGAGGLFGVKTQQALYSESTEIQYPDNSIASWFVEGGFDVTWRPWWHLLLTLETVYSYSPQCRGVEINAWIGFDWFINSINLR